ncbi:demethylmenaquinone methyltransferase-like [Oculina patagonica]
MAAECYQQRSHDIQMEGGKMFIQTDVLPQPRDTILDLGCGTGELSAYLAELVGPEGYVVGVDPDLNRVKVAQEAHRGIKNLSFVEGNSDNFEGMGSEKYDIIFLNQVLHWIPNKEDAFKNMFSSLKAGGKIAVQYIHALHPFVVAAFEELTTPEIEERCKSMFHCVARVDIDRLCAKVGFEVVKSYYANGSKIVFEGIDGLMKWLWATRHGAFDLQVVTQERKQRFLSRVGNPPFDFSAENINSRLIAMKHKDP